jgi:hypothetical protein
VQAHLPKIETYENNSMATETKMPIHLAEKLKGKETENHLAKLAFCRDLAAHRFAIVSVNQLFGCA